MIAASISGFCSETATLLQFIGYGLLVFKIAIPVVIIILGIVDFGKAVVAEKSDDVKTYAKRLLWRLIAGIIIFFVPNIVTWVFGLVAEYNSNQGAFNVCQECIVHPSGDVCKEAVNS